MTYLYSYPWRLCMSRVEQCRSTLMQVGTKALTPASVARVIGMMIRCPTVFSEHVPLQVML